MSSEQGMWTSGRILRLMRDEGAWLQRDGVDGFYYMVLRGAEYPVNQDLARQVRQDPRVIEERWREGWCETRETQRRRWRIDA